MSLLRRRPFLPLLAVLVLAAAAIAAARTPGGSHPNPTATGARASGRCRVDVASAAAAAHALAQAPAGGVVCLAAGTYPETLALSRRHGGYATLQAAPGAHVQTAEIHVSGSHVALRDLWIHGEVALAAGSSHIRIEHDDISNAGGQGGEGVVFDTSDCTVAGAPKWQGCEPQAPISDVTISHDHFHDIGQGGSEDAIHLDNWRNVTITGNELDHIIESGNHTDCLQSVYGGENLTFDHNYEYDNDCQGIFIKDGDATNVNVTDNLFIRDNEGTYADFAQLWNVHGLELQHNTIWDGKGLVLVADEATVAPTARIDHNVLEIFTIERPVGNPYAVSESHNVFGQSPWSFRTSALDHAAARPRFVDPAHDDYRLARNPHHIGIDWSPARVHYGPPH